MRWALFGLLIAGCTTDTADVPATVVHVNVTAACGDNCSFADLYADCGFDLPKLDTQPHVKAFTLLDPNKVAGLVQIQYGGAVQPIGTEVPRSDYVLGQGEPAEVYGLFDYTVLYRIDGTGDVTNIDTTRGTANGSTLTFEYMGNTEEHVIDAARTVNIETESPGACCSTGRPQELGVALLLVTLRRRRRRSKLRR